MKRWMRLGIIGVASFVLLVTVLPQVASGIGLGSLAARLSSSVSCSGDAASSVCGPHGSVSGTVTITGAPNGFKTAEVGVGACPVSAHDTLACANPASVFSANKKTYSLTLGVGRWRVGAFYELRLFGGAFIGPSTVINVTTNAKGKKSFSVPYEVPASITGTVEVTGVPSEFTAQQRSVILCPSSAAYKGGLPSVACVSESAPFNIAGLPPGPWTADPGFCAASTERALGDYRYQCFTNTRARESITLAPGGVGTLDVTTPFLVPGYGMVAGSASITGAPKGFSDPVGISACRKTAASCQTFEVRTGHLFELLLPVGTWHVNAFYLAAPFYNEIVGPTKAVQVTSGSGGLVNVSEPYQVLGHADGAVDVTGAPSQVSFESYTVLACPASSPWTGGTIPTACVSEYSGSEPGGGGIGIIIGTSSALSKLPHPAASHLKPAASSAPNSYELPTLTPGTWLLYPGYQTVFATYVDPTATRVAIVSGATTVENLAVPYQTPKNGAVTGTVSVVGAPANEYGNLQLGVEACSTPPTSCVGGRFAYSNEDGNYQLLLTPGTWSIRGIVQYYSFLNGSIQFGTSRGTPQEVTVQAGVDTSEDFTVTISP
jgi:hypothetical protein